MFDTIITQDEPDKESFEAQAIELRRALLKAQQALARSEASVIIFVGGLEGSGRGSMVHRLNEWMDPRQIETHSFWEHSDEEESHPAYWRFWRRLPPRGTMAINLGAWYNAPGYGLIEDRIKSKQLQALCEEINQFERMLQMDGVQLVKLWLHVGEEFQRLQLAEEAPRKLQNPRVPQRLDHDKISHRKQLKAARKVLELTDSKYSPWQLIDGEKPRQRDLRAGRLVLQALTSGAAGQTPPPPPGEYRPAKDSALARVDLSLELSREDYKDELKTWQARLQDCAWDAHRERIPTVAVFEGWDAAGKGSAIRRVTAAVDPRLYNVVQFAAPTDEERARHYLWRFWRRLERDGRCTIFDRSWYGRVLVERVEGFAADSEWQRAYDEINEFERQLTAHGTVLLKFWLHISPEEQLARFEERQNLLHKRHKITDEDWRNREKWSQYEAAVDDMIEHTGTDYAPWTVIPGNNKRHARVAILKAFCEALQQRGSN